MCGIYGTWDQDGGSVDIGAVRAAVGAMRHRGPDDEGYLLVDTRAGRVVECGGDDTTASLGLPHIARFEGESFDLVLGHRRLAILDTSPAGHQPMGGAGGWIAHSGEIFNYRELRERFGPRDWRSGSDTEVLLAAVERFGAEELPLHLNGMWGFAHYDPERRRLLLSRDRFGIKPLYLHRDGSTLTFASEIRAILASGVRPSWNEGALFDFLAWGMSDHDARTCFEGVHALRPGHQLLIEDGEERMLRYWDPSTGAELVGDEPRLAPMNVSDPRRDVVETGLARSVELRLRSDVPVGTCLSGGIDSSSVVGLMHALEPSAAVHTFTAAFEEPAIDERRYADVMNRTVGAQAHVVAPDAAGLFEALEQLTRHQELPFHSSSVYAQWRVMQLARATGVRVLLDGQGGDEVFSGYPRATDAYLASLLRRGRLGRFLSESSRVPGGRGRAFRSLLGTAQRADAPSWLHSDFVASRRGPEPWRYPRAASLTEMMATDLEFRLPALLRYEERSSMAFGMEARVPFLDDDLVRFAYSLEDDDRVRDGVGKFVLREAMRGTVPDQILDRSEKIGFPTPQTRWLLDDEWSRAKALALDGFGSLPFAHQGRLREMVDDLGSGRRRDTDGLWRCISVAAWADAFLRP